MGNLIFIFLKKKNNSFLIRSQSTKTEDIQFNKIQTKFKKIIKTHSKMNKKNVSLFNYIPVLSFLKKTTAVVFINKYFKISHEAQPLPPYILQKNRQLLFGLFSILQIKFNYKERFLNQKRNFFYLTLLTKQQKIIAPILFKFNFLAKQLLCTFIRSLDLYIINDKLIFKKLKLKTRTSRFKSKIKLAVSPSTFTFKKLKVPFKYKYRRLPFFLFKQKQFFLRKNLLALGFNLSDNEQFRNQLLNLRILQRLIFWISKNPKDFLLIRLKKTLIEIIGTLPLKFSEKRLIKNSNTLFKIAYRNLYEKKQLIDIPQNKNISPLNLTQLKNYHPLSSFYKIYSNFFLKNIYKKTEFSFQKIYRIQTKIRKFFQQYYNLLSLKNFFTVFYTNSARRVSQLGIIPEEKFISKLDLQLVHFLQRLDTTQIITTLFYYIKAGHIFINNRVITNPYYCLKLGDSFHISFFMYLFIYIFKMYHSFNTNSSLVYIKKQVTNSFKNQFSFHFNKMSFFPQRNLKLKALNLKKQNILISKLSYNMTISPALFFKKFLKRYKKYNSKNNFLGLFFINNIFQTNRIFFSFFKKSKCFFKYYIKPSKFMTKKRKYISKVYRKLLALKFYRNIKQRFFNRKILLLRKKKSNLFVKFSFFRRNLCKKFKLKQIILKKKNIHFKTSYSSVPLAQKFIYMKRKFKQNNWKTTQYQIFSKIGVLLKIKKHNLIPSFIEFSPKLFYGILFRKPQFIDFYFSRLNISGFFLARLKFLLTYFINFFQKLKNENVNLLNRYSLISNKIIIFNVTFVRFFSEFQFRLPWF